MVCDLNHSIPIYPALHFPPTTELPMLRVTLNPHNPSGPLWLVYWDLVTKSTTFLSEVIL